MKKKSKILIVLLIIIFAGIYYYVTLPAINLHSTDTWFFVIALIVALMVFYALRKKIGRTELKTDKGLKTFITIIHPSKQLIIYSIYLNTCSPFI